MYAIVVYLATLIVGALSHMQLSNPPPLRSKFNPYAGVDIDYSMTNPLKNDGSDFPCKGYHKLLATPEGTPVALIEGGMSYTVIFTGQATHAGGSCQVSLSLDGGQTFRVLHTYIGGCPAASGDNVLPFRVPVDVPTSARVLLAWSWFNRLGNREMYMNCASVDVRAGAGTEPYPFLSRPLLFVANVGNGCTTVESTEVLVPDPGPEVTVGSPGAVPPAGVCEVGPGAPPGGPVPDSGSTPVDGEDARSCSSSGGNGTSLSRRRVFNPESGRGNVKMVMAAPV